MITRADINIYAHCKKCIDELPPDQSPADYKRISVGFGHNGIIIWCDRHEELIAFYNIDIEDSPEARVCTECEQSHDRIH